MKNDIKYYPLSYPQKSIWYTEKLYPNTSIGVVAGTLRIKGDIDYTLLEKSINIFLEKNEAMRLRIVEEQDEAKQYIYKNKFRKIDFIDFNYKDGLKELYKWDDKMTREPFNIINSDLFYFALIKVSDNEGGFYAKLHHSISDAWTMSIVGNQIMDYYLALKNQEDIEFELKPSYAEYLSNEEEYIKSEKFQKSKSFWEEKFNTIPEFITLSSSNQSYINTKSKRRTFLIPNRLAIQIQNYCKENRSSIAAFLLTVIFIYIKTLTSKKDIVLGTTVLNRSNNREKNTVGMFISTTPIRVNVADSFDFKSCLEFVTKEWMTVLKHQRYPYELLLKELREKDNSLNNLCDILVYYQNAKFNKSKHSAQYETRYHFNGHQNNSLTIQINDREDEGHLILDYDYLVDLFSNKEIEQMNKQVIYLIQDIINAPTKSINDLRILPDEEKRQLIFDFNDTRADYPRYKSISKLFEEQVDKTPNNTAAVFQDVNLTYKQLNEKANQLARLLIDKNVKPDTIVGIMLNRSLEMVVAILGVLKAGAAYVPVDPDYPQDRIKYMIEDSEARILITEPSLANKVEYSGEMIFVDDQRLLSLNNSNLGVISSPNDLAYIIYTSGSTGLPKGVMIEQYGVVSLSNWFNKAYSLTENKNVIQMTTFSFDVSVEELIITLLNGATVFIPEKDTILDKHKFLNFLNKNKINVAQFVPVTLKELLGDVEKVESLNVVICGGEPLDEHLKRNIISKGYNLYNHYGPTEITVDALVSKCSNDERVNLGKPIDNKKCYIVDANLNLQPAGAYGELCIAGDALARGYKNRPELTKEKFVFNPFVPGERMYKTGDLAKWLPDGTVEYLGRIDHQVKIKGHRVELYEIKLKMLEYKEIKEAIVIDKEDKNGKKVLCAYIISEHEISISDLRTYLSSILPEYMIPTYFIKIDKVPLTPNGKIDSKALPNPNVGARELKYVEPRDEIETKLVRAWEEALEVEKIGIDDNFFELGGDSLTVIGILTSIFSEGWELKAQDFYKYQTIRELAAKLKGQNNDLNNSSISPLTRYDKNINSEFKNIVLEPKRQSYRNVFLTGATGFLGMHILDELLTNTQSNIYCLVRGENKTSTQKRFLKLLNFYFDNKNIELFNKRVFLVEGDITLDKFGLTEQEYSDLNESIDCVIHCAALTKPFGSYEDFEKINVNGTKEVIRFSLINNKTLFHISALTISGNYIFTNNEEKIEFSEKDFDIGQDYSSNLYVKSKYEAEKLIYKANELGLNANIIRIGNLTGRYSDGMGQIDISENAFYQRLKSLISLGAVPEQLTNNFIEFTPVDLCSRAIVGMLNTLDNKGNVFHLRNHNLIKIIDIIKILNGINIKITVLDNLYFIEKLKSVSKSKGSKGYLLGIINDFKEDRNLNYNSNIVIDSEVTQKYLKQLNFEWPVIDYYYIDKLINYMKRVNYI